MPEQQKQAEPAVLANPSSLTSVSAPNAPQEAPDGHGVFSAASPEGSILSRLTSNPLFTAVSVALSPYLL